MASKLPLLDVGLSRAASRLKQLSLRNRACLLGPLSLTPLLLVACSILTAPDLSAARGAYELERVDGAPLPIAVEAGDCPREIFPGSMGLTPKVGSRRPLFTVSVPLRLRCDPTRVLPVGVDELVNDFGEWTMIGGAVQLRSERGYGTQLIPLEDPEPGTPGPLLTVDRGGRRYTFRRTRIGPSYGVN